MWARACVRRADSCDDARGVTSWLAHPPRGVPTSES